MPGAARGARPNFSYRAQTKRHHEASEPVKLRTTLVWAQYFLFAAAGVALTYCANVAFTAHKYQAQASEQLGRAGLNLISHPEQSNGIVPSPPPSPKIVGNSFAFVGRLEIPRIGLSALVAEGSDARVLRVAVGHVPGTALPEQSGNVALVAHRDTFFRRLGELHAGDVIRITVPGSHHAYRVTFIDIVAPTETWVLQPATGHALTLVTCYPFHFIGGAPQRFVVRARRVETENE